MNIELIKSKIISANKILIIPSQPADLDCLCSALVMKWYVIYLKSGKSIDLANTGELVDFEEGIRVYSFFQIPDKLKIFPEIDLNITQKYLDGLDLSIYDLIIGVDGNDYSRYLTNSYQKYISDVDISTRFVNIDHHQEDLDAKFESDLYIKDLEASSNTLVLYKYFLKDVSFTSQVATLLYTGIVSDTGNFKWNINAETLRVASELLEKQADYSKSGDVSIPLKEIEFTVWAIEHTQYIPALKVAYLYIDKSNYQELDNKFGEKWDFKDLDRHYKNSFCKLVEGYDYYFIIKEDKKADNVRLSWRVRDITEKQINLIEILQSLGYLAGGHYKSGSARVYGARIADVWSKLLEKLSNVIGK